MSITGLQVHEVIEVVEFLFHPPNSGTEIERVLSIFMFLFFEFIRFS